ALNSVANGRILRETPIEELYIQPSAGDGGGALGAALVGWHGALGNTKRFVMDHAYWGQSYGDGEVERAINKAGFNFTYIDEESRLLDATVDRMVDGKVIGWYQGRFEWGPRALGNRSIIADPRKPEIKDIVNNKIKFREPFRPFAPSVLVDKASDYFEVENVEDSMPSRFMLLVVPVKDSERDTVPAVSHMGTARIQTVHEDTNPLYYKLIDKFGQATGVPVILNTSFNVKGEPVVNTPENALDTFAKSGIDTLVMGNHIVDKP
ncbi:MAG: hypothetical protein IIB14_00125, partial [Chloroflexi bacterium]|nr:hypothetical protein [Chloroflexota bacterium]